MTTPQSSLSTALIYTRAYLIERFGMADADADRCRYLVTLAEIGGDVPPRANTFWLSELADCMIAVAGVDPRCVRLRAGANEDEAALETIIRAAAGASPHTTIIQ